MKVKCTLNIEETALQWLKAYARMDERTASNALSRILLAHKSGHPDAENILATFSTVQPAPTSEPEDLFA